METIGITEARRVALARAGLLKPEWTGFPKRATGRSRRAREAARKVIQRFGYLQLDTISIAGARSHALFLLSRLDGFDPQLAEEILQPDEPVFEYWGHEASWIPIELYSVFEFRRRDFREHPWWGDLVGKHPQVAKDLQRRIRDEGPLRSIDMDGKGSKGWWQLKIARRVASALWLSGELAIRERRGFQRTFDLAERVIPDRWRKESVPMAEALETLLLKALEGHGWATTGTLVQTWRLSKHAKAVAEALNRLQDRGEITPCTLVGDDRKAHPGWIRPGDLELGARLMRVRPRRDRGVLLSPFDPVLWDRRRVRQLFRFDQILEVYKPAPKRTYGYFCLPVLAGDRLIARVDLKADGRNGRLNVLSCRFEQPGTNEPPTAEDRAAVRHALSRYSLSLGLKPRGRIHR